MANTGARKLSDLRAAAYNPRRVSKKRKALLKNALEAFGDLGGIVFNRHQDGGGVLVSGHARVEAIRGDPEAKLVITQAHDAPTANGTVAEGYVEHAGERFAYREVAWGAGSKERLANLAANKSAGSFDATKLAHSLEHLSRDSVDLTLGMFEVDELRGYLPDVTALAEGPREPAPQPQRDHDPQPRPERLRGPTTHADAPAAEAHEPPSITQVPLYFRAPDYAEFVALAGRCKAHVGASNVSDLVLAALRALEKTYERPDCA